MKTDALDAGQHKLVDAWRRNAREEYRATTLEYQGREAIDLRVWRVDDFGERPTRRGIRIPLEDIPHLAAASAALDQAALLAF